MTASLALSVQRDTNAGCELALGDRLLKQVDPVVQAALMNDRVPRVPSHVDDLQIGCGFQRLCSELATVHAGHDHVCQKQIDRGFPISENLNGGVCIRRGDDPVPKAYQDVTDV